MAPLLRSPASILLIKPGSLGDVVHALPVAAALHATWPLSRLTWVIDPRWAPVLDGNPAIKDLLFFDRNRFRGAPGLLDGARWMAGLGRQRPDLAIDLQCLLRSALIARASRARRVVGLSDAREGAGLLYHAAAPVTATQHAVDRYLAVLPQLGLTDPVAPVFPLPAGEAVSAPERFILLHPFARGAGKSLSSDQILGLSQRLAPHPVVLAGFGDAPANLPSSVVDLTRRTTLAQLIFLLRRARAVVSVDSGPMHLAAALDVPLLSIHTWSDPRRVGPYSERAFIWQGGALRPQRLDAPPLPERALSGADLQAIAAWARQAAA